MTSAPARGSCFSFTLPARAHPEHVTAVCIRQLSPAQAVLAGSAGKTHEAPAGSTVPWLYAPDGSVFVEKLSELGLLVEDEHQPTVE